MKNINLENYLETFIMELHNNMIYELRKKAMKFNFTFSQMEVLRYVVKKKDPTMKDIANYLHITPPSVTAIIEFLCGKGFIKREVDKNDQRMVRIVITPKALKIFNSFKNKKLQVLKNVLTKLNNKERKELMRILIILNKD